MTADRLLTQHKLEGMARRLKQLHHGCDDVLHHVTMMDHICDEALMLEPSYEILKAIEHMKSALIAVQIDLESVTFAMESVQLRASATARLVAGYTTLNGADHEKQ